MSYLLSFIPWIVFSLLPRQRWLPGALLGLGVGIVLIGRQLIARRRLDAMIIELSGAVFFALVAALATVDPTSPLRAHLSPVSQAWLAATAWGSLLLGRPFTLGIARLSVPAQVWPTPRFRRTNVVITAVWAAAFTAAAALIASLQALEPSATAAVITVQIGGFVLPMLFTRSYAARVAGMGQERPAERERESVR